MIHGMTFERSGALKLAAGNYLITADTGSTFYLGDTNTMMSLIVVQSPARFYVTGPGYIDNGSGTVMINRLPEKMQLSEGGPIPVGGGGGGSGKGYQDPGE